LWGIYDNWFLVYIAEIIVVWPVLAFAHGFTKDMHFYGVYRKEAVTPFDMMKHAIDEGVHIRSAFK
jgi:hypothetical protein